MIEGALLDRFILMLNALALTPAPELVGAIEPVAAHELPALVVALEQGRRLGNGLGERSSLVTNGALRWRADVNLANPVLPAEPSFSLLTPDRRQLTLPHGGLVRADASSGALTATDIQVQVNGTPRTLVNAAPGANDFSIDHLVGLVTFGAALPGAGILQANYFLGQWEQRTLRSSGVLRLAVLASSADAVRDLSNSILTAVGDAPSALLPGLTQFSVAEIGTIGAADLPLANARRRVVRFTYEYEEDVNVPESSGGIIQRVSIQASVN